MHTRIDKEFSQLPRTNQELREACQRALEGGNGGKRVSVPAEALERLIESVDKLYIELGRLQASRANVERDAAS